MPPPRMSLHTPDPLDARLVAAALTQPQRFALEVLASCPSTNTLLLERAGQGAPGGSVLACEHQSAGRGRRGRRWLSAPGHSLTFSLLWRFPAGRAAPAGLSLAAGVAVVEVLTAMGAAGVGLKWPNDILAGGAKLGGILVETLATAGRHAAVIGIGLNVRLPQRLAATIDIPVVALETLMPQPPARNLLLARLLDALAEVLDEFARVGFAGLAARWQAYHVYAGRSVRVTAEGAAPIEGRCAGVDADGALLLETAAGLRRIVSGDVTLRAA